MHFDKIYQQYLVAGCGFVSHAIYDGRLLTEAGCPNQRLVLAENAHPSLKLTGLSFMPVNHIANRQASAEELGTIRAILADALRHSVVDRDGRRRKLELSDILVVAPYKMQVNRLRDALPEGARIGTVDKFQGQEAEIVIVSITTSGPDDMLRSGETSGWSRAARWRCRARLSEPPLGTRSHEVVAAVR